MKYYKEFVKQRGDDKQLRQELAEAHFRVGQIAREIGTTDELITAFDAARAIWEQVAASAPDDPAPRGHVADCYLAVGERLTADKDFRAAIRPLQRAPGHPGADRGEASRRRGLRGEPGRVLQGDGDRPGRPGISRAGPGVAQEGRDHPETADRSIPRDDEYRKKLADIINVQGYGYYRQGDYSNALRSFQEVQAICQSLLDQITSGPRPVQLLNSLALAHYNIATVELRNGNLPAALAAFERSLEFRSASWPRIPR